MGKGCVVENVDLSFEVADDDNGVAAGFSGHVTCLWCTATCGNHGSVMETSHKQLWDNYMDIQAGNLQY